MADVDGMSDAEIRTKLMEFGFPVMPITGTTRKVMVKKLKLLLDNKGKAGNDRRSLAQFSSEEESDTDTKASAKSRRQTMAVVPPPMQPPAGRGRRSVAAKVIVENDDVVEPPKIQRTEERKTRVTKIVTTVENDETNSDSEPDIVETDYKPRESPIKTTFSYSTPKSYSPPKSFSRSTYSTAYASPIDANERLNQIRSRLSLGNSMSADLGGNYVSSTLDEPAEPQQTPFLSNFTRRLSLLRETRGDDLKADIKENDSNGASSIYTKSYLASRPKPRYYTRDYQSASQDRRSGTNYASLMIIGAVLVFFVVLALLYWGMHGGDTGTHLIAGKSFPLCNPADPEARPRVNCLTKEDTSAALDFYKVLRPVLHEAAVDSRCKDSGINFYKTEREIVDHIKKTFVIKDDYTILEDMRNFEFLLYKIPPWDVSLLMTGRNDDFTYSDVIDSYERVLENRKDENEDNFITAFAVLEPSLPFGCSFYLMFTSVVRAVLTILAISTAWFLGKKGYIHYKHYESRRKDEIILMVERIIDILQSNASEENDGFLVVNHVRDMILPIKNRKKMESTWDKAVKFISENESRIRTEVQIVKGEPYEVWRWVGCLNTSAARNKSWQGQAFETQIGSVNSPPCSPTPCLKIRGMVDDGDRNLHTIREAVLVKCADQCRILHCAVDANSKCVYLKCADQNDAAIAFRNLHGWWYASHLVTVKYLRLERYMQRFPDSPQNGPPYLKASQPIREWTT